MPVLPLESCRLIGQPPIRLSFYHLGTHHRTKDKQQRKNQDRIQAVQIHPHERHIRQIEHGNRNHGSEKLHGPVDSLPGFLNRFQSRLLLELIQRQLRRLCVKLSCQRVHCPRIENMLPNKIASSIQYLHIDRGRSYPQSSRISGLE